MKLSLCNVWYEEKKRYSRKIKILTSLSKMNFTEEKDHYASILVGHDLSLEQVSEKQIKLEVCNGDQRKIVGSSQGGEEGGEE